MKKRKKLLTLQSQQSIISVVRMDAGCLGKASRAEKYFYMPL